MSRIDELIREKCPDGVVFEPLWKLTTWDKRFNAVDNSKQPMVIKYYYYLANDLRPLVREKGDVKILTTNESELFASSEEVNPETIAKQEVVAIPWGGNPIVQYYKGKFITADNRIAISNDTSRLDTKFLYYVLLNRLEEISSFYRGSGIKHPSMAKVLDMQIPVPPLDIQREIVGMLDDFAELEAELEAELVKRKQQYEYYRDFLFSFNKDIVPWLPIGEVLVSLNTGLNPRRFFRLNTEDANNYYVTIREIKGGNLCFSDKTDRINDDALRLCNNRSNLEIGDILFSGTGTIGETYEIKSKPYNWNIKEGVYSLKPIKERINPTYLSFILRTEFIKKDYLKKAAGGTVKSVPMAELKKIKIPVPLLPEQERIVSVLESFDALTADLSIGLPAEIEARHKQYEYYRDKLLTFEEIKR